MLILGRAFAIIGDGYHEARAVEATAQHTPQRYSVKVGGEWYTGFGSCRLRRGVVYLIRYTTNGQYRNIKTILEIGELVRKKQEEFGKVLSAWVGWGADCSGPGG